MPIEDLTLELRELGKLKLGEETADRPRALDTWRLTSRHPNLIEAAEGLYGGTAVYTAEGGGDLITDTAELDVLLPPQDVAANQWFEHWQAGGLQRRCTGTAMVEFTDHGWEKIGPCLCEDENRGERLCKPTTVLRVVLPELPDIGIWRLTTKSIYAAQELPGVAALLLSATANLIGDALAPAVLGIDSRTKKTPGQPPHHFKVPVLRSRGPLTELLFHPERALEGGQSSSSPAALGGTPTAIAPTAGLDGALEGEIEPIQPQEGTQEAENRVSGPTTHEEPIDPIWDDLAALLTEHTPDTITGEGLATTIHVVTTLERLMQAAHLWPENALAGMARKWLGEGKVKWRGLTGPDIKAFGQRVVMQATREVEETGLGSRALQRHRQQEEETHADRKPAPRNT